MINKNRLVSLTQKLIRINSENPGQDEFQIAGFIYRYLLGFGLKARIIEFKKRRSNLVAVLKGKNRGRSLLVTPHLDTVPRGKHWKKDPFSGEIKKGRIYGLGATDCKGNLACAIEALNSLIEDKVNLGYDLIFAATADEECGSGLGLVPLLEKGIFKPDEAVVLDSDNFNIIITQKGLIHMKVYIWGRRAHGAYPERGQNAIGIAVDILKDLKGKGFGCPRNVYLKPPTLNIGTIRGGDKVNIVADWCEFELDLRFLPGMDWKNLVNKIKAAVSRHAKKFRIELTDVQDPYRIEKSHRLVGSLCEAMRFFSLRPKIKGSEGATVITFFQHKNIPAVATGFGARGCGHSADEYAKIDDLYMGSRALERFLKRYSFID